MIRSIELQNFKSFGAHQKVTLEPITVLVGPNNSGKSAFMSVSNFIGNLIRSGRVQETISAGGGIAALAHRPPTGDGALKLGWTSGEGSYSTSAKWGGSELISTQEALALADGTPAWETKTWGTEIAKDVPGRRLPVHEPFGGLLEVRTNAQLARFRQVYQPLAEARFVQLSLDALRADAPPPVGKAVLSESGAGLAQVLSSWREEFPGKAKDLDAFISKVLPEIDQVLVTSPTTPHPDGRPSPPGTKRLLLLQKDSQRFDALQASDGVLCFVALAMHAIDLEPGALLFVEEPELGIHPTRLHEVVDLLRQTVAERAAQIVIATHSRVLLNEFRKEPECIRVFRRSANGSEVRRLTDLPQLQEALHRQTPGEMLEQGFFELAGEQADAAQ